MNCRQQWRSSANDFATDSTFLWLIFYVYHEEERSKNWNLRSHCQFVNQLEDWQLRPTLWNILLRKLWKSLCNLPEIPNVSTLQSNPLCRTLSKAFTVLENLPVIASDGFWSSLHKCCEQLILVHFTRVRWSKTWMTRGK